MGLFEARTRYMKVYKNFLKPEEMLTIKQFMESADFPWYASEILKAHEIAKGVPNMQFVHPFYNRFVAVSHYFEMLLPIINKLKIFSLLRVKSNLTVRTSTHVEHGMHVDFVNNNCKIKTGIFYVNSNDGYSKFENGEKIQSIENQYVEFDSHIKHTGSSSTDHDRRMVINFNYIKDEV